MEPSVRCHQAQELTAALVFCLRELQGLLARAQIVPKLQRIEWARCGPKALFLASVTPCSPSMLCALCLRTSDAALFALALPSIDEAIDL